MTGVRGTELGGKSEGNRLPLCPPKNRFRTAATDRSDFDKLFIENSCQGSYRGKRLRHEQQHYFAATPAGPQEECANDFHPIRIRISNLKSQI